MWKTFSARSDDDRGSLDGSNRKKPLLSVE